MSSQQQAQPMGKPEQPYNPNYPQGEQGYNANAPKQIQMDNHVLLYIIAFFLPPLAVFMHTGVCGNEFIIDLVLSCLFWIPGFIYAILIIRRDQQAGVQPKMTLLQPTAPQGQYPQQQYNGQPQKQTV